jgi:DNA (cytosine-5)-methyltransferase 1
MKNIQSFAKQFNKKKFEKQLALLKSCEAADIHLATALKEIGWTYDDLQYESSDSLDEVSQQYFTLDDFKQKQNSIPVVSFFSGAGGLDLGFEAAGFQHTALIEKNQLFCSTLKANRKQWKVFGPPDSEGDVSQPTQICSALKPLIGKSRLGYEGVFIGGPPCQPFSIAANQRFNKNGDNFKRVGFAHKTNGNLLFDYIKVIKEFRPAAFLIENVPGLLEIDNGEQLKQAYEDLARSGYTIHDPMILVASNYNVPQNRTRLFIVGNRLKKSFTPPPPAARKLPCGGAFLSHPVSAFENHTSREHSAQSIARYMKLRFGERDQLGRVDRLDPRLPSKTVIAGGTAGGGRSHLHPFVPRTLTVRECAVLQTFPDDYVFEGPIARQFTQVGNAVPPILGAHLARALHSSFFS